eukprot:m.262493 g.262493  ORF g.262493 m.262493 type:complete len:160 (+) comp15593_c0_seq10:263-742(+)
MSLTLDTFHEVLETMAKRESRSVVLIAALHHNRLLRVVDWLKGHQALNTPVLRETQLEKIINKLNDIVAPYSETGLTFSMLHSERTAIEVERTASESPAQAHVDGDGTDDGGLYMALFDFEPQKRSDLPLKTVKRSRFRNTAFKFPLAPSPSFDTFFSM